VARDSFTTNQGVTLMKDKNEKSQASRLIEKYERGPTKVARTAEEILVEEIRIRQKMLDPEKFSNQKVTIK
jgi:hypothetical protein